VSAEEARRRLKAGEVDLVIDVRTAFERATLGSYDGSVHIPAGSIEAVVPDRIPKKDTRILLFCNTGQRARAAAEKLDPRLEEAARSLGASPFGVLRDVLLPGMAPAMAAAGAICFATATGAFGTAFALASRIDVLPMVIYTEFTLQANLAVAAALSFLLGIATWAVLALARGASGGAAA
jgi:rhodanese-related sulfurtransferase